MPHADCKIFHSAYIFSLQSEGIYPDRKRLLFRHISDTLVSQQFISAASNQYRLKIRIERFQKKRILKKKMKGYHHD